MLIKRRDVVALFNALYTFKDKYKPGFRYTIKRNKDILYPEICAIKDADKSQVEEYNVYELKRSELIKQYGKRTAGGKLLIQGNDCVIPDETRKEFDEKLAVLDDGYRDAINMRSIEKAELEGFLNQCVEIDIVTIDEKYIPDSIPQDVYEAIFPMIVIGRKALKK